MLYTRVEQNSRIKPVISQVKAFSWKYYVSSQYSLTQSCFNLKIKYLDMKARIKYVKSLFVLNCSSYRCFHSCSVVLLWLPDGPSVVKVSGPEKPEENSDVTLTCTADCNPACNYIWTKVWLIFFDFIIFTSQVNTFPNRRTFWSGTFSVLSKLKCGRWFRIQLSFTSQVK